MQGISVEKKGVQFAPERTERAEQCSTNSVQTAEQAHCQAADRTASSRETNIRATPQENAERSQLKQQHAR
jgi:hypothetical protein